MDARTRKELRERLDLSEAPYRMTTQDYDPSKSFKQVAIETLQELPEDAPWELVVEQLKKAKYLVFDQATYKVGERAPTPIEDTIPGSGSWEEQPDG